MPSVIADVDPRLLEWARKTAGFTVPEAAKKLGTSEDRLSKWEAGDAKPTIRQLRVAARVYRRSIAVFYLPEPPADRSPPRDFRRLPGQVAGVESPSLRYEIRRASLRREIALDLMLSANDDVPMFPTVPLRLDSVEGLAQFIREQLRVSFDDQVQWRTSYDAFNGWRAAVESAGAMVLQMTDVEVSEARAFSISDFPLPAIVLNIKDPPRGRVFSLLHEVAHVVVRSGGLCDLDDTTDRGSDNLKLEQFCNAVAGAALVPQGPLLETQTVSRHAESTTWSDEELDDLSRRFGASREAVLRRLLDLGLTSQGFYRRRRAEFLEEYEEMRRNRSPGFAPPPAVALASAGPAFTSLVLSSYAEGAITASDVSDYLNVRLKHVPRIAEQLAQTRRIS